MYKLMPSQEVESSNSTSPAKIRHIAVLLVSVALLFGCAPPTQESTSSGPQEPELGGDLAKASYGMGYTLGNNVKQQQGDTLDYQAFLLGARESLEGTEMRITQAELKHGYEVIQGMQQEKKQTESDKNKNAGEEFLTENGKREGVITLESGLQYQIMTQGEGAKPSADDRVKTHYHGTLIDGTVFDSSVDRGQPAVFPVNGVIRGWVEALQLMPVGSKWRLFIPSELAYGERGAGGAIGPNAALVFEVELLEIVSG